jgi:hypothetical protein
MSAGEGAERIPASGARTHAISGSQRQKNSSPAVHNWTTATVGSDRNPESLITLTITGKDVQSVASSESHGHGMRKHLPIMSYLLLHERRWHALHVPLLP